RQPGAARRRHRPRDDLLRRPGRRRRRLARPGRGDGRPQRRRDPRAAPPRRARLVTTYGLGPDWVPGPDGVPFRRAARVILLDDADRLLLVRGHDAGETSRSWWFTVGGGLEPGEDVRAGALRELR